MYEIMTAEEAVKLIKDGDCICVNSFVGIESPVELHEAIYKRFKETGSPAHLTMVSSAGFGVWDENRNAEGYIRDGAVDRLICGHFGAMLSTKKLILEDRFEAYNLPLGCISHAIRAQAGGLPVAEEGSEIHVFCILQERFQVQTGLHTITYATFCYGSQTTVRRFAAQTVVLGCQ